MTRKQINKLADELAELELIHQNSSNKEEIMRTEKRIMSITNQLITDPKKALQTMAKIDELVQQKIKLKKGEMI